LEAAAREHPTYRLVITGHSQGAGVPAVLALILDSGDEASCLGFSRCECYAFACPSIASEAMSTSEVAMRRVTSIACGRDCVPRLCAASVGLLLDEVAGKSLGSFTRKSSERNSSTTARHFPVGRCFLLDPDKDGGQVLVASPTDFGEILVHERMTADHLIGPHETCLTAACRSLGLA